MARAQECFAAVAERAEKTGVFYCIEPLSADQTPLINTIEEAAAMVKAVGSRSVRTMLDCSAASRMETAPLPALVETWVPRGMIAHVQVNDRNRRGPGQGEQRFAPRLAALVRHGCAGDIAVEPFDSIPRRVSLPASSMRSLEWAAAGRKTWRSSAASDLRCRKVLASFSAPMIHRRSERHFGLGRYFNAVYGSELDGTRSSKAELIAHILKAESLSPSATWMVGDRSHDMVGASANGVCPIGVLWGYGSRDELVAAGAAVLCWQPAALKQAIIEGI